MKNISVFTECGKNGCRVSECPTSCGVNFDLFRYATDVICEEYDLIHYTFAFDGVPVSKSFLRSVLSYEKSVSSKRSVRFYNTVRMTDRIPEDKELRFCKKHKISLDLVFSDIHSLKGCFDSNRRKKKSFDSISISNYFADDPIDIYEYLRPYCKKIRFKQFGMPSYVKTEDAACALSEKLRGLFDVWIADKNGIDVSPLSDHIRNIFGIRVGKECTNSSCLGKALAMDRNGELYLCPYSRDEKFALGNLKNISRISELFGSDKFNGIVSDMIEKRKKCMQNCTAFAYCQSGCCADVVCKTFSDCYCEVQKELDRYIRERVQSIIKNDEDLAGYNPTVAGIIKDVICCNPISLGGTKTGSTM